MSFQGLMTGGQVRDLFLKYNSIPGNAGVVDMTRMYNKGDMYSNTPASGNQIDLALAEINANEGFDKYKLSHTDYANGGLLRDTLNQLEVDIVEGVVIPPVNELALNSTNYGTYATSTTLAGDWHFAFEIKSTGTGPMNMWGDLTTSLLFTLQNANTVRLYIGNVIHDFVTAVNLLDGGSHNIEYDLVGTTMTVTVDTIALTPKTIVPYTTAITSMNYGTNSVLALMFIGVIYKAEMQNAAGPLIQWIIDNGSLVDEPAESPNEANVIDFTGMVADDWTLLLGAEFIFDFSAVTGPVTSITSSGNDRATALTNTDGTTNIAVAAQNGLNAAVFAGANALSGAITSALNTFSAYMVIRTKTGSGANTGIFSVGPTGGNDWDNTNGINLCGYGSTDVSILTRRGGSGDILDMRVTHVPDQFKVYDLHVDVTNGVAKLTYGEATELNDIFDDNVIIDPDVMVMGARFNSGAVSLFGTSDVGEIRVYPEYHNAGQAELARQELYDKWAITEA